MQLHQLFYPWLHSHGNVWILCWRLTTKMRISYFCLRNDLKEWWLTFLFHLPETWGRRGIFPPWFSFPNCCGALRNLGITPSSRRHLFSSPAQKVPIFCAILPCSERRDFYGRVSEVNVLLDFFCMNLAGVKTILSELHFPPVLSTWVLTLEVHSQVCRNHLVPTPCLGSFL